jgi:Ca-activated chloride channel family protein
MGGSNKMEFAQKGIQKLVTGLTAEDRVGLLGFDHEVCIERKLSAWKPGDDLGAELKRLQPRGSTDLNQGLLEGMKMLRSAPSLDAVPGRPARAQRLLVITDAQTNTGECDTERVVKSLEDGFNAGVRLTAIGVGLDYNDGLLSRLTRIPGNNGRFLDRADEIAKSLQTLFDALLPLEVDKPQLSLELPANVTVKHGFGTTFTQQGRQVTFPKLTSMGSDDYQLIMLQLDGSDEALRQVAGAQLDFEAWSPMEKRTMRFGAEVTAVDVPVVVGTAKLEVDEGLVRGLRKATTVALAADALKRAAESAKAQDFAGADRAVTEAEKTLDAYDRTGKDREISEIRAVVVLDRQVLQQRAQAQLIGTTATGVSEPSVGL